MTRHVLVVGAQRCGTTYLTGLLDAHPQITTARPSRPEPKVFLSDELAARGLDWYRRTYFAHATTEPVLAEKSTSYLEYPAAAERAYAMLGAADIVAVLRDPVLRAISNWRFSTDNGLESRPLAAALADNLDHGRPWDRESTSVSPFAYLERGRYTDFLRPWDAAFGDRVHLELLADLLEDTAQVGELYGQLGVDPAFRPSSAEQPINPSEAPAPDLPADLVADLRGYFADSDAALRHRLGRDLPWPTTA